MATTPTPSSAPLSHKSPSTLGTLKTQLGTELLVARRYLFAKKSQNVINIISAISAMGVMVATAAVIIVLSVFNGLNGLVSSLFGSFDPDVSIQVAEGKHFTLSPDIVQALDADPDVLCWTPVVQDNALVRYAKRQVPAVVMGVGSNYASVTNIDSIIVEGTFRAGQCVIGVLLADQLAVSSHAFVPNITLYAPKRVGRINMSNPQSSFVEVPQALSGTFMVQQSDYDATYVIVPIASARTLFGYPDSVVTSLSLRMKPEANVTQFIERHQHLAAAHSLIFKDKWLQHESFFKMMEVEKLMSFLILLFIVLIAVFNIIGSLSMLIFEKKESISVFRSMGANRNMVTRIFLFEGWLVSVGGAILGLVLGVAFVLAQEHWGFIGFGGDDNYIIDSYPVSLQWTDVALVFVSVVTLAALAAWWPVRVIVRKYYGQ